MIKCNIDFKGLSEEELCFLQSGYIRERLRRKEAAKRGQRRSKKDLAEQFDALFTHPVDFSWELLNYLAGADPAFLSRRIDQVFLVVSLCSGSPIPTSIMIRVVLKTRACLSYIAAKEIFRSDFAKLISDAENVSETLDGFELVFRGSFVVSKLKQATRGI